MSSGAGEAIALDGRLDESIWEELPSIELSPFGSGPTLASRSRVFVSNGHLFVGARFEDEHVWSTIDERDGRTWTEEVFELFIDANNDGENYLELQINPIETVFDANFDVRLGTGEGSRQEQIDRAKAFDIEGLESAVHVEGTVNDKAATDEFWSVELKIPLGAIPDVSSGELEPGSTWAVNLYRFDRPSDEKTLSFAWSTRPRRDFHQVDEFGTFRFVASDELDLGSPPRNLEPLQGAGPNMETEKLEKLNNIELE